MKRLAVALVAIALSALALILAGYALPHGALNPSGAEIWRDLARRSALAPDTATVGETFPGYEVVTWYSIAAPAKTPQALVNKLNGEIVRVLSQPDRVARLAAQGHDARPGTPEDMVAYTRSEIAKFSKLVKLAGVKASE